MLDAENDTLLRQIAALERDLDALHCVRAAAATSEPATEPRPQAETATIDEQA